MKTDKWKYFTFDYLFRLFKGKRLTKAQMNEGKTPYISSSALNNGVDAYISEEPNFRKYFLTFACYGSIGKVFYHPYDAWVSDNCNVMYLKNYNLNEYIATFLIGIIEKEKYRFSYGFTGKLQALKKLKIKLPSKNNEPDFEFMENFIKNIVHNAGSKTESIINNCFNALPLNDNKDIELRIEDWKWFEINSIFKLEKCKCYSATELLDNGNDIYYIGAKKNDNGIMQRVENVEELISKGNCITFIGDGQGSVGYTTYQPIDFIGSTTLTCGYNYKLNKYNTLFLITVLDLERFRYSFGRKYGKAQLLKTKIKLPSKDGQPDWEFMENFIKSLPYSSSI